MSNIAQSVNPINKASLLSETSPRELSKIASELTSDREHTITKASSSPMEKIKSVIEKVKRAAFFVLNITISAFLYWVNPSLFAISFIAGIILDDEVQYATQKIKKIWQNQKFTGLLYGSIACALSMPVTIATASILWSASLSSLLSKESEFNNHPSSDERLQMHSLL